MFRVDREQWQAEGGFEQSHDSAATEFQTEAEVGSQSQTAIQPRPALGNAWLALLDELAFGIAVVDSQRRLAHANRVARASFGAGCGLRLADSVLEATSNADAPALREALASALAGRRRYLSLGPDGAKACMAVLPLALDASHQAPLIALVFERDSRSSGLGMYFFARAHHISSAEERVLVALADGASVGEVAGQVGCAQNTARTHVRNLLQKTGLANLRMLVARLGRLPPVASRALSLR